MQYPVVQMSTERFSDWFQVRLKRRGWSPSDFARDSGVPQPTVSAWYRGTRVPGPSRIPAIAGSLGFPVEVVMKIAGHLPDEDGIDPHSPAARIASVANKVNWAADDSREQIVIDIMETWIERDREAG